MLILSQKVSLRKLYATFLEQLRSGSIWGERDDYTPMDGLSRALEEIRRLQDERLLQASSKALQKMLVHNESSIRERVLLALAGNADILGSEVLTKIYRKNRSLYQVAPLSRTYHPDIAGYFLLLLADTVESGQEQSIDLLREAALDGRSVLPDLSRCDAAWVIQNAQKIITEEDIGGVLMYLPTDTLRLQLIESLAGKLDAKQVVSDSFWKLVDGDVERMKAAFLQPEGRA